MRFKHNSHETVAIEKSQRYADKLRQFKMIAIFHYCVNLCCKPCPSFIFPSDGESEADYQSESIQGMSDNLEGNEEKSLNSSKNITPSPPPTSRVIFQALIFIV